MTQPARYQLRDLAGDILIEIATDQSVEPVIRAMHAKVGFPPERSSFVMIVGGRVIGVASAPHAFDGLQEEHPNPHFLRGDLYDYMVSMAQHSFEQRAEPQYQLIPPVLTFQKLDFGADSDEANIAAAALVDRISHMFSWDKSGKYESEEGEESLWWDEFYPTSEAHGELGDTNIREAIAEKASEKIAQSRKHREYDAKRMQRDQERRAAADN